MMGALNTHTFLAILLLALVIAFWLVQDWWEERR